MFRPECKHFDSGMVRDGDNGWDCSEPPSCTNFGTYGSDIRCHDCTAFTVEPVKVYKVTNADGVIVDADFPF